MYLSDCGNFTTQWTHNVENITSSIQLKGSFGCLRAVGDGHPAIVSSDCTSRPSFWKHIASSKLHIASQVEQGKYLCLEKNSSNSMIFTRKCLCLDDLGKDFLNCTENPQRQWFKFVPRNVK